MTRSRATIALSFLFGLCVAVAVLVHAMQQPLDHDEHQFIASAALIVRDGMLPFRDFPYFHLPYLSFVYAPFFAITDRLLAVARSVSAFAALGVAALLWRRARTSLFALPELVREAGAALFVLALVTNPLFLYTAGRSWNHDLAVLPALGAAIAIGRIPSANFPARAAFVGGALFGLATGTRATIALIGPALLVTTALVARRQTIASPARVVSRFVAGTVVALLPLGVLYLQAPAEFVFGNVTYNLSLNPLYRERMGYDVAMSDAQKLGYFFDKVLRHPRMAALVLAYLVTGAALLATPGRSIRECAQSLVIALCLPLLLVAALLPTPTWYQYYYALVPFLLLGTLANFGRLESGGARAIAALAIAPMLAGAVTGARYYRPVVEAPAKGWTVNVVHDLGTALAAQSGTSRVLTLGPTYPLEGGLPIFPSLVTGPFAWRTTPLVDPDERASWTLLGPDELDALGRGARIGALLTGVERDPAENLEASLLAFVEKYGWEPHEIGGELTLWLRPSRGR